MKYITNANKRGDGEQFIDLRCPICKNTFKKRLAMYNFVLDKNPNHKFYCDSKCRGLSQSKYGIQICVTCGKEIPPKEHTGHKRKFCSRKCYDIHQDKRIDHSCLNCGKKFISHPNRRFCSRDCSFKYTGETSIEKKMREELNKRGLYYETQVRFKSFYLDFLLINKVVIECDGIHWHSKPEVMERDKRKEKQLKEQGYTLFRFTDKEINADVGKCVNTVLK